MLSADHISFAFDPTRPILRGVSCTIEAGSVSAIIGPNGAGKTTLLRLLAGLLAPDEGSVFLRSNTSPDSPPGPRLAGLNAAERAARIAYVAQSTTLAFEYTARAVVAMGRYRLGAKAADVVQDALRRVSMLDHADRPYSELSAGQRQRINLARAIAQLTPAAGPPPQRGQVLLADEPFAAMDPRHAIDALNILRELAADGVAIGLVVHDLNLAAWADRVLALGQSGQIVAAGPAAEVLNEPTLQDLFGVAFVTLGPTRPGGLTAITLDRSPQSSAARTP